MVYIPTTKHFKTNCYALAGCLSQVKGRLQTFNTCQHLKIKLSNAAEIFKNDYF